MSTLVATCLGAAMTFLQVTATFGALPRIQDDLRLAPDQLVWVSSAYTLAVAALVLSTGTLGDRHGRKRTFALGIGAMMIGSAVVATAGGLPAVLTGQLITGVGGALVLPNSLALLSGSSTDPHRRAELITVWAASSGVGLAGGPLLAGVLLAHGGWHFVFVSTIALGAFTLVITLAGVTESRRAGAVLDPAGQALAALAVAALVWGLIQGGHHGYASAPTALAWLVSAAATLAFVHVERRVRAPMLQLGLFRSRSFTAVMVVATVALFGFTGMGVLTVLYYERVQGLDALSVGWRLLVMFGTYILVAACTGRLVRSTGFKAPLTLGLALGAAGALGLALVQQPSTSFTHVWPLLLLFGAGCGLVIAPSTAAALVSVPHERAGMAASAVNTSRQLGAVLGTSLLGTVLTSRLAAVLPERLAAQGVPADARGAVERAVATGSTAPAPALPVRRAIASAFTSGAHAGYLLTAALFLLAAVVALTLVHNRPHQRRH